MKSKCRVLGVVLSAVGTAARDAANKDWYDPGLRRTAFQLMSGRPNFSSRPGSAFADDSTPGFCILGSFIWRGFSAALSRE